MLNLSRLNIILTGFENSKECNHFCFLLLLTIYCVTICGNLLIIVVVSSSRSLHSPMYFFLTQLSLSDILLSTTIVPNMLHVMYDGNSMSLIGCLIQYYFFLSSESFECLLLTVMSYDRYQAICHPLHYTSSMDLTFCITAILFCWLMIFIMILTLSITMRYLHFCGPNIIDHFFCDFDPILKLSCSDTFLINIEGLIFSVPIVICPFTLIIVSYTCIIATILKLPSVTGRQKTFSTCSSHLAVVSMYYGTIIGIYLFPSHRSAQKAFSLVYTVISPLLNPVIYSLSNREIKQALKRLLKKSPFFLSYYK